MSSVQPTLAAKTLIGAVSCLSATDPDLGKVVARIGPPPLWNRAPGFPALVQIILEQQVSLASARSAYDKLNTKLPKLDPRLFLTLDDQTLRDIGFSGQKGRYCRGLARTLIDGELKLEALPGLADDEVSAALEQVVGIGPWTSGIYLLMVLLRPDVWPPGDLALVAAIQDIKRLDHRPGAKEIRHIAERWKPWRSVAARILWNHYLNPE